MKKEWNTPSCTVECFEANEYVAVCWGIACIGGDEQTNDYPETQYDLSNWSNRETSGEHHHNGSCTDVTLNRITTNKKGNLTMQENSSDQGWIDGGFDSYIDSNNSGGLDAGDMVFWHTNGSGNRRWNHCGVAVNLSETHPNHS